MLSQSSSAKAGGRRRNWLPDSGRAHLLHIIKALRLIWSAAQGWTIAWVVLLVLQGLVPAAIVYLTRPLVNAIAGVFGEGISWATIESMLLPAILMAVAILLKELLQSLMVWVRTAQADYVQDHVSALVHVQSVRLDIAFYETAEYFDKLHRARDESSTRPLALLDNVGTLLQSGITFVAMVAILFRFGVWIPLLLLIGSIPAFVVLVQHSRLRHRWWEETTKDRRWTQYYNHILTSRYTAPEIRMMDLGGYLMDRFQDVRSTLRAQNLRLSRMQGIARIKANLAGFLVFGAGMAWMVLQAMRGTVTLGDLALFYQAFNQGEGLMRSLLSRVGEIYNSTLFLGNLYEFLEQKPEVLSATQPVAFPAPIREGIQFENITFRYPWSERTALRNFNLEIPAGQVVAVVGANGAGKSTLLKLLCRLYDPESGRILIDGIDLRDLSLSDLRRQISVMFQFPVYYEAAVIENIRYGDLKSSHTETEIEMASRGAGAHEFIESLPHGYHTFLGRMVEDGTELSGGEWQRIALARAFLRRAPILVLDEPTSSMDSWAEAEWLDRFRQLVAGRIGIIITHRFTTAMRADTIHLMHKGQILESGTHEQLLAIGGMYAQSWRDQTAAASTASAA